MKHSFVLLSFTLLSLTSAGQDRFVMKCHPFQAIEVHHPIDTSCGTQGKGTTEGAKAQNTVKNNFCAGSDFQELSTQELVNRQQQVESIAGYSGWSGENLPTSRSQFEGMDEGKPVRFVGYILEAHNADLTSGESVNCGVKNDVASNDIHIALVGQPGIADECQSITAEMIPHYRPSTWTKTALARIGHTTLVRVSGQLMFDGAHKVCGDAGYSSHDPKRSSDWEIHPVYAFEVCVKQSGGNCTNWQQFSDWAAKH